MCGLPMDNLVDAELLKKIQFSVSQKLSSVNNSLDRGGTLCLLPLSMLGFLLAGFLQVLILS